MQTPTAVLCYQRWFWFFGLFVHQQSRIHLIVILQCQWWQHQPWSIYAGTSAIQPQPTQQRKLPVQLSTQCAGFCKYPIKSLSNGALTFKLMLADCCVRLMQAGCCVRFLFVHWMFSCIFYALCTTLFSLSFRWLCILQILTGMSSVILFFPRMQLLTGSPYSINTSTGMTGPALHQTSSTDQLTNWNVPLPQLPGSAVDSLSWDQGLAARPSMMPSTNYLDLFSNPRNCEHPDSLNFEDFLLDVPAPYIHMWSDISEWKHCGRCLEATEV